MLIVGGTVVVVAILTFLVYALTGYEGDGQVAGGQRGKLAAAASVGACGQGTPADPSYTVDFTTTPDPPRPDGTTLLLNVRHDGKPVAGAKVCLTADMPDMQHSGLNKASSEVSSGKYEARIQFGMGGSWRMSVTIAEPDRPVVSVPLVVQVAQVDS